MSTLMPCDSNENPIPVLRLRDGGAHKITVTATSARNATAFHAETKIVGLYATGPVFIKMGNSAVTATGTDHYFPGGMYYDLSVGGGDVAQYTHIAAIRAETDCVLYISEKI